MTARSYERFRSGFTLVETLVSIALLLIFFAALITIYQIVIDLVGESRIRIIATTLAAEKVEEIRNLSYEDVGTQGGIPDGVLSQSTIEMVGRQEFEVDTTVVYIDDEFDSQSPSDPIPTDYKRVRIAISWGGAFPSRSPVIMVTDVVPDGLETNVGGGTLIINTINSSGETVENADVHIVNTSVTPNIDLQINSNNDGEISLPGSPICTDCYEITVSKAGFTQDRTYSLAEVANPLKPHASVLEGELTELTFSIDLSSTIQVVARRSEATGYAPFQGVEFVLAGTQIIGTNDSDEPVYKYQENLVTGSGGVISVSGLSPDIYSITLPPSSSIDITATDPILPINLLPNQTSSVTLITNAGTGNSLLLAITDLAFQPIATATATIIGANNFIATASAGLSGTYNHGQAYFGNILAQDYTIYATQSGYLEASATATVTGDTNLSIVLPDDE